MVLFLLFVLLIVCVVAAIAGGLYWQEKQRTLGLSGQLITLQQQSRSLAESLDVQLLQCKQAYAVLEKAHHDLRSQAEQKLSQFKAGLAECQKRYQGLAQRAANQEHLLAEQDEKMRRWTGLVSAEAEAKRIVEEGASQATRMRAEAEQILRDSQHAKQKAMGEAAYIREHANHGAETTVNNAREKAHALTENAKRLLADAQNRAAHVLADAESRAREIAGEAYEVKLNVGKYEKTLKAIKNEIQGYGDEYIIPSHSLLDDLAEEFGYAEAGQQLKAIRMKVKSMVQLGEAAECDYVEANRRETAIRFVVDAFNGKADSVLSLVKHDNFGKLSQQIKDAFLIVNSNGEAFRNARITQCYLEGRLEELRWATIVHELRKQEQEEQRRIKEQIREEAKARREYERAIKEAAREEELVQKTMAKLQQQLGRASAEERAKYESQLQELQEKLRVAEEKGQRAISMAQQTKCGYVYIISNVGSFGEHVYKIGLTRRLEPLDRVRELGDSSVPFEFDVHALIKSDDAPALENQLHRHFLLHQVNKVNHRKEFFRCDLQTIRNEVEQLGLQSQWTMRAAAQEFRESLAIEKKIAADPLAREQWLQRQLELDPTECDGELVDVAVGDDEDA